MKVTIEQKDELNRDSGKNSGYTSLGSILALLYLRWISGVHFLACSGLLLIGKRRTKPRGLDKLRSTNQEPSRIYAMLPEIAVDESGIPLHEWGNSRRSLEMFASSISRCVTQLPTYESLRFHARLRNLINLGRKSTANDVLFLIDSDYIAPAAFSKVFWVLLFRFLFKGYVVFNSGDGVTEGLTYGLLAVGRNGTLACGPWDVKQLSGVLPRNPPLSQCTIPNAAAFASADRRFLYGKKPYQERDIDVLLPGNLYGGRRQIITPIIDELQHQYNVVIPSKNEIPYPEYWALLCRSKIVVTTNFVRTEHVQQYAYLSQNVDSLQQLVGKNFESMAAGSLLLMQDCPNKSLLGTEGIHFVSYTSPLEAVRKCRALLDQGHESFSAQIARMGYEFAVHYAKTNYFWRQIFDIQCEVIGD